MTVNACLTVMVDDLLVIHDINAGIYDFVQVSEYSPFILIGATYADAAWAKFITFSSRVTHA